MCRLCGDPVLDDEISSSGTKGDGLFWPEGQLPIFASDKGSGPEGSSPVEDSWCSEERGIEENAGQVASQLVCSLGDMSIPAKMDEKKSVVEYFQRNSILIQSEAVDFLVERGDALKNSERLLEMLDDIPMNITLEDVKEYFDESINRASHTPSIPATTPAAPAPTPGSPINTPAPAPASTSENVHTQIATAAVSAPAGARHDHIPHAPPAPASRKRKSDDELHLEILRDVTGKSSCEGSLSDFTHLFRNRYETLYGLLRKRQELRNVVPLKRAQSIEGEVTIIGMVGDIKRGKNGNILVDIEDESDTATLYIPDKAEGMASTLVEDEVIGVVGKAKRGGLILVQDMIWPDIPLNGKKEYSGEDVYAAFVSDIHIGSKTFLEKEWKKFIEWINGKAGNERQRKVAEKIKYILMPGDIVDGVGIYPHQEEDLVIEDLYGQYKALVDEMKDMPQDIKIIIQPGNHDAVRPALPQPAFGKEIREIFSDMNAIFVGNPCYLSIEGVSILSYHGQSIQDFSTRIGIDQNRPTDIMKSMLQRRHMSPIYGDGTPLAPEKRDYMVIDMVPDIFVTGHVHTTAMDRYRGVLLINASTWQSQTDYQKMMDFSPDPAKVPIVNLGNGRASLMDFGA